MILNRSTDYWAIGITLTWNPDGARDSHGNEAPGWSGQVDYYDDGWTGDDDPDAGRVATEGTLRTRYVIADGSKRAALSAVIDTLLADGESLGIRFGSPGIQPMLLIRGDGEWADSPAPDGWRELLTAEATRVGWGTYPTKG
jgi:hypothetical protein